MKKVNVCMFVLISIFFLSLFSSVVKSQVSDIQEAEAEILKKAAENIEKYRKGDVVIRFKTSAGKNIMNGEAEITQKSHDFLFGAIIFDLVNQREMYRPELFKQRFKNLFNFAVFPFYWGSYEQAPGMTRWENMLPVIEWCKNNAITTKGHPLVWTHRAGTPQWLSSFPESISEELLKARVLNTVNGFDGLIDIWDVVNEPVNTKKWTNYNAERYIQEPIQDVADYVEKAFKWAYTANPEAHLILNEYNTIAVKSVRDRFVALVKELQSRNTPISGLGIQAHEPREHWYPPEDVWETFNTLASFGYPLHITEFIPQSSGKEITGGWRTGTWTVEEQADFAEQFYRLSFGHPSVVSINWWGVSDRNIWLSGGGLLTEDYTPKPVYNSLSKLIHEVWKTKITITIDRNGELSFRGFYGEYDIVLKTGDGTVHSFTIHVRENEENRWTFSIKD